MQTLHNFYRKLLSLDTDSAVVLDVLKLCKELAIVKYYEGLPNNHCSENLLEKKRLCIDADGTYSKRYVELTELRYCHAIYETFMREDLRITITRWRMSCFDLAVETGRYEGTARDERLCPFCDVVEDEHHAIFVCKAYDYIRNDFRKMLSENSTVKQILNPGNKELAEEVGRFLKHIEDERKSLL